MGTKNLKKKEVKKKKKERKKERKKESRKSKRANKISKRKKIRAIILNHDVCRLNIQKKEPKKDVCRMNT